MRLLRIPVRYYYVDSDEETWRIESKFHYIEKEITINPREAALILVDIWREGFNSFSRRAAEITVRKIVPVIDAARKAGIAIVHAPSPRIAINYLKGRKLTEPSSGSLYKPQRQKWPPEDFVKREGKYSQYSRKIRRDPKYFQRLLGGSYDIAESVKPLKDDFIVVDGNDLQQLLLKKKILHLFYAGFYVNMCVLYRDYGIKAMADRGYNIILLRDCTTAIETHDTVNDLLITKLTIRHIETLFGFSTSSEEFLRACSDSFKVSS